jgi:hypothetical protein
MLSLEKTSATRFTSAEREGAVLATTRALPAGDYVGSRAQFLVPQLRSERKRKTSSKLDENNITQRLVANFLGHTVDAPQL